MTDSIYTPIDPSLVDVTLPFESGYPEAMAAMDTDEAVFRAFGETGREFPSALLVPKSEWKDRAAENDKLGLWAWSYIDRFTNQSPTHECTCHALEGVALACWNRQRRVNFGGPKVGERNPLSEKTGSVWFSVNSVYAEANPGERGGANVQQVIGIACRRGFLPDIIQPRNYGFKHFMWGTRGKGGVNQSTGSWPGWSGGESGTFRTRPSGWANENWRETAKHFMPLECVNPQSTEQVVSLLLHGYAIGVGRSGHSVPYVKLVWDSNGRMLFAYRDSYDVMRYDSSAAYSGSYSILSMTQPDDYNYPAGK